jgi:hypothetical protein
VTGFLNGTRPARLTGLAIGVDPLWTVATALTEYGVAAYRRA